MQTTRLSLSATLALAFALTACGSDNGAMNMPAPAAPPAPAPVAEAGDTVVLTSSNKLVTFNLASAATIKTAVAVSGLQSGESLIGIDYRPADGMLYGVGSTGRIYTVNPATGALTFKAAMLADAADASAPYAMLAGASFGVDFNPVADRLRVVSNTGQSLRINVDTGATTTDGDINGGPAGTMLGAAAYTNAFAGTGATTLYVIDAASGALFIQSPPNNGTLGAPVSLGVTASASGGFDIDARNNKGYAVLTVGGARNLYAIDLAASTNAATLVTALAVTEDVTGIAVRTPAAPMVYGLTDGARIVGFKPATPGTLATDVALSGLNAGEKLLGFDVRPKDGTLYGITSAARIVTIDPVTGVATAKSTLAADAADLTAPYAAIAGTQFAVDFNPVADRLRVISDSGQSLRINVDSGATTTDGAINRSGATPVVSAAAYANSFAGTTSTMLFDVDTSSDSLALQNPPNDGTLTNVGALGVDVSGDVGIDIAGGANGLVLAALRTSAAGPSLIYRVDLATGAATPINGAATPATSAVGNGSIGLSDLAIVLK
ncbi:DUF4394 domain-containing protein [Massilia sp. CF038]|uniref:DUF4394 domain-containing protein n=1 Tax=Massilia sp. CF038 TaxID=1881045 RepID=UPI000918EBA6|nr:DUF4394 domain-containing protein [Massilia sp. CF038]SHH08561.1 protein of unknown function [Massilia sp. CF038]